MENVEVFFFVIFNNIFDISDNNISDNSITFGNFIASDF